MNDVGDEVPAAVPPLGASTLPDQALVRLAEALPLGVLQVDWQGRIVYASRQLGAILGVARSDSVAGQFATVVPGDTQLVVDAFDAALRSGLDDDITIAVVVPGPPGEGEVRRCTVSLRVLTGETGVVIGAVACVADAAESVTTAGETAVTDGLDEVTRCLDGASTMASLEMTLAASSETLRPAVIVVNLDRFKDVNDKLGHAVGDEMLGVVAKRIFRAVRDHDIVGRIGGDEFLVVCPAVPTATQATRMALRVADSLRHPVRLKAGHVSCQAGVGVAWSAELDCDALTLVQRAVTAMGESKRRKSGRPVLYSAALSEDGAQDQSS